MSQCPYHCSLRDFHSETTIFDKAKTTNNNRWRDPRDFNDSEHYNKRKRVRQS